MQEHLMFSSDDMNFDHLTFDDHFAATTVAALGGKRDRSESHDHEDIFESTAKRISLAQEDAGIFAGPPVPPMPAIQPKEEMQAYPFFHYRDFSMETDPDPLTPLTPPGRVPNFPSKMQAILSRQDLADIIAWMPHGRSWRVLKPREFEVRVIPTYFEHAKFSSFIRQANGWGFRRITQGRDRNSYYHPLFLRGLPHLCKRMKRPGVSEKQALDPDHEPDLYKVSEMHPVPEKTEDEAILLQCTIQGGPKARMPIYSGSSALAGVQPQNTISTADAGPKLSPSDQQALAAFQQSLGASENQLTTANNNHSSNSLDDNQPPVVLPQSNLMSPTPFQLPFNMGSDKQNPLVLANQMAFASPQMPTNFQSGSAASQFAAGFAAATALSHQQFQAMLASLGQGMAAAEKQGSTDGNSSPDYTPHELH